MQGVTFAIVIWCQPLISIFLEKKTTKIDKNSSKPSSQTDKDESALEHNGSKGKGKNELNESAYNTRTSETTIVNKVSTCNVCGEDISGTPCVQHEKRTKIDIVFEKVVVNVVAQIKICPACENQTKGSFPADMHGPLQYGNGLKAYVISLLPAKWYRLIEFKNQLRQ